MYGSQKPTKKPRDHCKPKSKPGPKPEPKSRRMFILGHKNKKHEKRAKGTREGRGRAGEEDVCIYSERLFCKKMKSTFAYTQNN